MSIRSARDIKAYPFSHGLTDRVTSYATRFRVSSTYQIYNQFSYINETFFNKISEGF